MKIQLFPIALGTLMLACGSVRSEHVLTGRQLAPHPGKVEIVMEGAKRPGGVKEIAIVQVFATGTKAKLPTALDALEARAQALGCDIVVNVRVDRGQNMSVTGVCGRRAEEIALGD